MPTSFLREVRLTAFKSFRDEVLPIDAITVLTGRNSAGKSNALDAIEVLSRLATGEELADALDGRRREGGPIRGGSRGCAPHGTNRFELGCTVEAGGVLYELDVVVEVEPELRIVSESLHLTAPTKAGGGRTRRRRVLQTQEFASGLVQVTIYNRTDRPVFTSSRLFTGLIPSLPVDGAIGALGRVAAVLRGVFPLDPIPHMMRGYVPERDGDLRRTGQNISAAIHWLQAEDPPAFDRLSRLVRQVGDERIRDIVVTRAPLGDVMLALREGKEDSDLTPAREMSDGLLRFMAIATALLTANRGLDISSGQQSDDFTPGVLLVIEELENGLHPSQAGRVLELIKETSASLGTQVMVTTHSPALLNEMTGELNRSVIVCYRDETTNRSRLSRLPDLPGYAEAMAAGPLGDVVTMGRLVGPESRDTDYGAFNRLLGIE